MKRPSFFSIILLLGICVACQDLEIPFLAGIPPDTGETSSEITRQSEINPTPFGENANGMIAFYSHRDGNIEIYIMNPDGSDQRRVTFNEYDDDSPAWSPDRSQIAFISNRDDPNPKTCAHSCFYQLYLINTDGSGEHKLTETEFSTMHPDWYPDALIRNLTFKGIFLSSIQMAATCSS